MPSMKTHTYKYTDKAEVMIPGLGTFQPGETRTVEQKIDHPEFEAVKEDVPEKAK